MVKCNFESVDKPILEPVCEQEEFDRDAVLASSSALLSTSSTDGRLLSPLFDESSLSSTNQTTKPSCRRYALHDSVASTEVEQSTGRSLPHFQTFHPVRRRWQRRYQRRNRPRSFRVKKYDEEDHLVLPNRRVSDLIERFSVTNHSGESRRQARDVQCCTPATSLQELGDDSSLPTVSALALLHSLHAGLGTNSVSQQTSRSQLSNVDRAPEPFATYCRCRHLLDSLGNSPHQRVSPMSRRNIRREGSDRLPSFLGASEPVEEVSSPPECRRSECQLVTTGALQSDSLDTLYTFDDFSPLDVLLELGSQLSSFVKTVLVYELLWALLDSSGARQSVSSFIAGMFGLQSTPSIDHSSLVFPDF